MPGRATAARPVPATGAAAPAVVPAAEPVLAGEAPHAEAASVNGEASPDRTAVPNGAASRNGPRAADGVAGHGGSVAMGG